MLWLASGEKQAVLVDLAIGEPGGEANRDLIITLEPSNQRRLGWQSKGPTPTETSVEIWPSPKGNALLYDDRGNQRIAGDVQPASGCFLEILEG